MSQDVPRMVQSHLNVNNKHNSWKLRQRRRQRLYRQATRTVPYFKRYNCAGVILREHLAGINTRGIHRLVRDPDYFGSGFDEERVLGRKVFEQDLLDRSLAAPAQELSGGGDSNWGWRLTFVTLSAEFLSV